MIVQVGKFHQFIGESAFGTLHLISDRSTELFMDPYFDVSPGLTLGGKRLAELLDFRQQSVLDAGGSGDVDRRWEGIVCGLRAVDVIVWVYRLMAAQWFPLAPRHQVADHLIDIHVRLGAASGLPNPQGELIVVTTLGNVSSHLHDQVSSVVIQHAQASVHDRCRLFDLR